MDGRAAAREVRERTRRAAEAFAAAAGRPPCLAVLLMGSNPASATYVASKEREAGRAGIRSIVRRLPDDVTLDEARAVIDTWNRDRDVDGILVQWPFPPQVPGEPVFAAVDPAKDVDGFHPENGGRLLAGAPGLVPCTPLGIMDLLERYRVPVAGAEAVVLGRSNIVGKPAALLLLHAHATVTVCHSRTRDLAALVRRADVVVAAMGRPRAVTGDMIKRGAAVIDVGINRMADGTIVGDVDFPAVEPVAGYLTPVPGGVGPMTIAMLLRNTVRAAAARAGVELP